VKERYESGLSYGLMYTRSYLMLFSCSAISTGCTMCARSAAYRVIFPGQPMLSLLNSAMIPELQPVSSCVTIRILLHVAIEGAGLGERAQYRLILQVLSIQLREPPAFIATPL